MNSQTDGEHEALARFNVRILHVDNKCEPILSDDGIGSNGHLSVVGQWQCPDSGQAVVKLHALT